jgi:hypothetical protein
MAGNLADHQRVTIHPNQPGRDGYAVMVSGVDATNGERVAAELWAPDRLALEALLRTLGVDAGAEALPDGSTRAVRLSSADLRVLILEKLPAAVDPLNLLALETDRAQMAARLERWERRRALYGDTGDAPGVRVSYQGLRDVAPPGLDGYRLELRYQTTRLHPRPEDLPKEHRLIVELSRTKAAGLTDDQAHTFLADAGRRYVEEQLRERPTDELETLILPERPREAQLAVVEPLPERPVEIRFD